MHPELVLYINYCFLFYANTLVLPDSLTHPLQTPPFRRAGRVGASGQRGPQPSHHPGRGRKCDAQVPGRRQAAGDVLCLVQECEYYMHIHNNMGFTSGSYGWIQFSPSLGGEFGTFNHTCNEIIVTNLCRGLTRNETIRLSLS